MQSKRVSFHTLGCKLNFSETSTLARRFAEEGYIRVAPDAEADIYVINSCSVTEHSDKKCRNLIRKLHRRNPAAIIAVTGCYAQLKPQEVAGIEGVDLVLGNNDKGDMFARIAEINTKGAPRVFSCETEELTRFFAAFSSGDRTRAFLKVQDGCDYKCSYCTIHYARGSSRNIPIAQIVDEARTIAAAGQKEIVITGVNTGDFGRTTGEKFVDLLRALDEVEGIERFRISSIEPNLLTDEIVELCASSPRFMPHFHVPLQSGSDSVLGRMRRRYTTARYADRIAKVRSLMPDAFIGIDVIVGFPGETEADFETTFRFLEDLAPAYLHVFPFSERAGTPAVDFPDKVPPQVAAERAARLGELCGRLHRDFCASFAGEVRSVLFEGRNRGGVMSGFTDNYIKVTAPYDRERVNTLCGVRLGRVMANGDVEGEIVA